MLHASGAMRIGDTVRERAAREIRDRILTGLYPPGTRLELDVLTAEFGASRTPLREALLELSYEGLVRVAPRSHIRVVGFTPQDVLDNFALLGTLAGKAAEWAAERMSDQTLAEIEELAAAVPAGPGSSDELVRTNWRFHRAVHHASGSKRILTLIRQTVGVVPTNFFEVFPDQRNHSVADHTDLLAALRTRDAEAARRIAERHVAEAGAALSKFLDAAQRGPKRPGAAP